jgi:hypothetical protein
VDIVKSLKENPSISTAATVKKETYVPPKVETIGRDDFLMVKDVNNMA